MKIKTFLLGLVGVVAIGGLASAQLVPGVNSNLPVAWSLIWETSTLKPTYSAVTKLSTASSATDVCAVSGSASKGVRVRRVTVGTFGTSTQIESVGFIKRSTAPTGGGAAMPITPYDSINLLTGSTTNTPTAGAEFWTSNPTVGTIVGYVADPFMMFNASTANFYTFDPATEGGSPIVLRGVAESLAINLGGITVTGGVVTCRFEWTEE